MNKMMSALVAAAALVAAPTTVDAANSGSAAPARPAAADSGDAEIPFIGFGGIQGWNAPNDNLVYLQGPNGQWYRADMMGPCMGLSYAMRIGVRTGGLDTIDRFSTLIVDGQPCPIAALSRIKGSPPATPAK